jgi:hypothetical protein
VNASDPKSGGFLGPSPAPLLYPILALRFQSAKAFVGAQRYAVSVTEGPQKTPPFHLTFYGIIQAIKATVTV